MIVRTAGGWKILSHKGKSLSRVYKSKNAAAQRMRQIEYFKRKKK